MQFEKDILNLECKLSSLRKSPNADQYIIDDIEKKKDRLIEKVYSRLTPWQRVQIARHPDRPKFSDYVSTIFTDFVEIRGDRLFGQDNSIITGFATISGVKVALVGQEKGKTMEQRIKHNFGMPLPEGYRKAQRLMHLADKFSLPIVSLVDTSGAFPGIESEERGQAEAIARCIETSFDIDVPIVSVIIGEGGSGGAVAIASADYVLMLENSIYSVISPEGCASILWKDESYTEIAASSQKLIAGDLLKLGVIDHVIQEKSGGAHRHPIDTMMSVQDAILEYIRLSEEVSISERKIQRRRKFMNIGSWLIPDHGK